MGHCERNAWKGAQQRALNGSGWCCGSGWMAVRGWLGSLGVEWWGTVGGHSEHKGGWVSEASCCLLNWISCALTRSTTPAPPHLFLWAWLCICMFYLDRVLLCVRRAKLFCSEEIKDKAAPCFIAYKCDFYFQTSHCLQSLLVVWNPVCEIWCCHRELALGSPIVPQTE